MVSVTGAVERPTVIEVALGTPLRTVLSLAGADPAPRAMLLGGYGGSWIPGERVDLNYDNESLASIGASVGAGVLCVLGRDGCGVVETERVVRWMANESARQCGPCAFGLPAMGEDLAQLSAATRDAKLAHERLIERGAAIIGRGACHHPDGVVRLVRSALDVFADDVAPAENPAPQRRPSGTSFRCRAWNKSTSWCGSEGSRRRLRLKGRPHRVRRLRTLSRISAGTRGDGRVGLPNH